MDKTLNELIAERNDLQTQVQAVTAQIIEVAEGQRRAAVSVLEEVGAQGQTRNGSAVKRRRTLTPEQRANYSNAAKQRWARRLEANGNSAVQ